MSSEDKDGEIVLSDILGCVGVILLCTGLYLGGAALFFLAVISFILIPQPLMIRLMHNAYPKKRD